MLNEGTDLCTCESGMAWVFGVIEALICPLSASENPGVKAVVLTAPIGTQIPPALEISGDPGSGSERIVLGGCLAS